METGNGCCTIELEGEVPDGDGQHEEASDNATSPVQGHDDDVEQHNDDSDQRSQLQDAADEPQLATDTGDRPDDDDELLESKTTLRRQSKDGSTEPAADCSHSPPTGILPRRMYKLSLTNPRDALHHGKRAANKGGR